MKALILLTAAVTPDPAFLAADASFRMAISDPAQRALQYVFAIERWRAIAQRTGASVAVVETSGAIRSDVVRNKDVQFVSFPPPPGMADGGKGAIEAAALDHAVSTLNADPASLLVKVTGRLVVSNAASLMTPLDEKIVQIRRSLDRGFADSRFLLTTISTWQTHLTGMAADVDDDNGRWLERVIAQRLIVAEYAEGLTVQRFLDPPRFEGASGTTGARYDGWRHRAIPNVLQRKAEGGLRKMLSARLV